MLAPANGYVEVQNLTRAVIMCDEGYALSLSGGSVVSCLGSGLWSEYGAECEISKTFGTFHVLLFEYFHFKFTICNVLTNDL